MAQEAPVSARDRIEQALDRIEAALAGRDKGQAALATRHAALRQEMSGAIAALDRILATQSE